MSPFHLQPYLYFGGRCEEAIAFYREAIGARQEFLLRFEESPEPMPPGILPPNFGKKIMHGSLRVGDQLIMVSNGCGEPAKFAGFTMALTLPTADEAARAFQALAAGGEVMMLQAPTFWSPLYGMLKDRFGVPWMVMAEMPDSAAPTESR